MACSAPSGALGLSLPEGGRRPATAKGAVPAAPPDWPEANLAPGPGEEGVSSPRPLKTAGAGGPKGNKCPPAPAWPHLPWLHQGPCPCAHLPGWKALTVQTRERSSQPTGRGLKVHSPQSASLPGGGERQGCVEVPEIQRLSNTVPTSVQTYGPWPQLAEGCQTPQTPTVTAGAGKGAGSEQGASSGGEPGAQIQRWRGLPKFISKVKGYGAAQSRYRND